MPAERSKRREICVLGFRGVGKSSITVQFVERIFVETYYPTIENTFRKDVNFRGESMTLQILDTTGQDELTIFSPRHMVGIHGYLLVYDVTSRQSFRVVQYIYEKILNAFLGDTSNRYIPIVLVGNKCDLDHDRKVSVEEGRRLASEWKCSFVECSAKHDENIKAAFNQLLLQVQENEEPAPIPEVTFCSRWGHFICCCCFCCNGTSSCTGCWEDAETGHDEGEDDFGWRKDGRGSGQNVAWDGKKNGSYTGSSSSRNQRDSALSGVGWLLRNRSRSVQASSTERSPGFCCCLSAGMEKASDSSQGGSLLEHDKWGQGPLASNDVNSTCTACRLRSERRPCLQGIVLFLSLLTLVIGVGDAITGFQIAARDASVPIIPAHNTSNTTAPSPSRTSGMESGDHYSNVPWKPTTGADLQGAYFAYGEIGLGIYTVIVSSIGGVYGTKRKSRDLLRLFGCSAILALLVHLAAYILIFVYRAFQLKDSWVVNSGLFSIVMPVVWSVEFLAAISSAVLSCNVWSADM